MEDTEIRIKEILKIALEIRLEDLNSVEYLAKDKNIISG